MRIQFSRARRRVTALIVIVCGLLGGVLVAPAGASIGIQIMGIGVFGALERQVTGYPLGGPPGTTAKDMPTIAPGEFADYVITWNTYYPLPKPAVQASVVVSGPCGTLYQATGGAALIPNATSGVEYGSVFRTTLPVDACLGVYRINMTLQNLSTASEVETGWVEFTVGYPAPAPVAEQQTRGCGNDTGTANTTVTRGDPVNTATGAACETFTDAAVPAPGIPFAFIRTYNSNDTYDGPLGRGWSHPYDMRLVVAGTSVVLRASDGQQVGYTRQSDNTFLAPPGARSVLSLNGTGYKLQTPAHDVYLFDSAGQLTAMRDRAGLGLSMAYASGVLTTVTDAAGRVASLSYTAGRLTGIALADGRTVAYGYTGGLLTSFTDARGKVTTYGYDAGPRLNDVIDPLGDHQLRNTYDPASARVVSQLDALGRMTTYGWDAATGTSTMTDPRGGRWRDVYRNNVLVQQINPLDQVKTLLYDDKLRLVEVTDANGTPTRMSYDVRGNLTSRAVRAVGYQESWTYAANDDVLTHTDGRGGITKFAYTGSGQVASVTDPANGVTTFTYDPSGGVATTKDARLKTTTFSYDAAGNRTSATTPLGLKTTWTFDSSGRTRTRVDPRGNVTGGSPTAFTTSWTYDAADHIQTLRDPRGDTTTYAYDDAGRLSSVTDAVTRVTAFGYDLANRPTTVTDARNKTATTVYDDAGNITAAIDARGGKSTYGYDLAGRRTSMVTPRGNITGANPAPFTTAYTYDAVGNQKTMVDPRGKTTTFGYDAVNRRTSVTDPLGHITRTGYDANGNATSTSNAMGQATTYTYDVMDRPVTITDPRGKATAFTHDVVGNRLTRTTALGNKTTWAYDDDNRVASMVDPRGNVTRGTPATYTWSYGYNAAGQRTTVKDPLARTTTTAYDPAGNVASVTDAKAYTLTNQYDALNRLASVSSPTLGATSYSYDEVGNLVGRTDAKAHATTYAYDDDHHLISVTTPLGKVTSFGYDADGNQTTRTSPREAVGAPGSGTATTTYDNAGRPTRVAYGDSTPSVDWTYDDAGRLASMTDSAGSETYAFDDANRLTGVTRNATTFAYGYDSAGNITSRTYPDGTPVALTYDNDGRLATIASAGLTTTYGYDVAGHLTTTTLPSGNGHAQTRTWDAAAQLTQVRNAKGSTLLSQFAMTRDSVGNPTQIVTTRGKTVTNDTYSYDPAGRPTQACYGTTSCTGATASIGYGYDQVGNRASETRLGVAKAGSTTFAVDADDRLTASTTAGVVTAYGYDEDGNQTRAGANTSTYDLNNRVTSTTAAGVTTTYGYDGNGRRTSATSGAATTRYTWDTNTPVAELAAERDGAGALLRRYINGPGGAISMTSGTQGAFYFHNDGVSNISDVTSATGVAQHRYTYEPFGAARTTTKLVTTAPENRLQFQGQYLDTDTGQYHLRARQYDPATGRFGATDAITPAVADPYVSAYAFAGNRPTVYGDPTGLSWCPLGRRADDSCNLGGVVGDTGHAIVGVVTGTVGFAGDTIYAGAHPVKTWKGMRDACQAGLDKYANDTWAGIATCVDNVNPQAGIRRNFQRGMELARQGCVQQSSDELTRGTWGVAADVDVIGNAAVGRFGGTRGGAGRFPGDQTLREAMRDDSGSIGPRDVHGEVQAGARGVDVQHVLQNGDLLIQNDGQLVRVLDNGNGTSQVVIRDASNPSGQGTTSMVVPNSYVEGKIANGDWGSHE